MTVWKYPLSILKYTRLELPYGAKPLRVGLQNGSLYLWALVDPQEPNKEERGFYVAGTGHPLDFAHIDHIGGVQMGDFEWHVFEVRS